MSPIAVVNPNPASPQKQDSPAKVQDAARQFEALLIGQLLKSVRESGTGWLGGGADAAGSTATEYAEQHLATVLAQQGGLGIAGLLAKGLKHS